MIHSNILFRANGNAKAGYGHLMRLVAIASYCKSNYNITFLISSDTNAEVIPKEYSYKVIPVALNQELNWINENYSPNNCLYVYDGYEFDAPYQAQLKDNGYKVVFVDDLAQYKMTADVVLNHGLNYNVKKYSISPETKLALGVNYALLRKSFLQKAKQKRLVKKIEKVFVSFGGADTFGLSKRISNLVSSISQIKEINVVVGSVHSIVESDKIKVYQNLNELQMLKVMEQCDLAIVPSSTVLYELCSVKMPIIGGYFADNQKEIYTAFKNAGAIIPCDDYTLKKDEELIQLIEQTISNKNYDNYLLKQSDLFDGKSDTRVLGLINSLNVSFKKATAQDLMLTYNWSNDNLVRSNSFNTSIIELAEHEKWFKTKIESSKTLFLIALVNNQPAGIVRYEAEKNNTVVGVLVANEYRGQGLARVFLEKSANLCFTEFNKPICAYIKEQNVASLNAFKKAGYIYFKKEKVNEVDSLIFKLEN